MISFDHIGFKIILQSRLHSNENVGKVRIYIGKSVLNVHSVSHTFYGRVYYFNPCCIFFRKFRKIATTSFSDKVRKKFRSTGAMTAAVYVPVDPL